MIDDEMPANEPPDDLLEQLAAVVGNEAANRCERTAVRLARYRARRQAAAHG